MANQQTLQGNWNEIVGKLRQKWGQLSGDELNHYEGNTQELVGFIQRKTGESREQIERFLNDATAAGAHMAAHVAEHARHFADQAMHTARDSAEHIQRHVREGYASAEQMIKESPGTSVAAAFGAGLITGVVLGLMMRATR